MLKDNIQKHFKSADHKKGKTYQNIMRTDIDQHNATANKHHAEVTAAMSNILVFKFIRYSSESTFKHFEFELIHI